jgi:Fe-Mn family superoxide dismutase
MTYEPKTFDIPETPGISKETMDNHLNLYAGYVKHVNLIREAIAQERDNGDASDTYALSEMQRRLGFEFGGMKNHEYYFSQFEGGSKELPDGRLKELIESQWGSVDNWLERFKQIAKTRGVGWAMLYYDNHSEQLVQTWVDEQQLGQLADLDIVLALDMWEHSYMHDYLSSDKGKYIDAFFNCLNWEVVAGRLA